MLGTIVNSLAIAAGSLLGVFAGGKLPERISSTVMSAMGLFTFYLGIKMAFETTNSMVVLLSLVIGSVIGGALDIEGKLEKLGNALKKVLKNKGNEKFTQGFVAASILYCVGPMAIMGAINDGVSKDHSILFTKSVMDGISSIAFGGMLGIGVTFSAVAVLVYQGIITVFAGYLAPVLSTQVIAQMTATGGIMLLAIGLNIVFNSKLKVGNMLPALFVAIAMAMIIK